MQKGGGSVIIYIFLSNKLQSCASGGMLISFRATAHAIVGNGTA
jgi:hypothetical protein